MKDIETRELAHLTPVNENLLVHALSATHRVSARSIYCNLAKSGANFIASLIAPSDRIYVAGVDFNKGHPTYDTPGRREIVEELGSNCRGNVCIFPINMNRLNSSDFDGMKSVLDDGRSLIFPFPLVDSLESMGGDTSRLEEELKKSKKILGIEEPNLPMNLVSQRVTRKILGANYFDKIHFVPAYSGEW